MVFSGISLCLGLVQEQRNTEIIMAFIIENKDDLEERKHAL